MLERLKKLKHIIDRGAKGFNIGMSMGLPRVEELVDGVQRATYTLLVGGTGSGKTSFALYAYIYRPLVNNLSLPVKERKNYRVLYYSFEMSAEVLLAKLLSLHLYEVYGRELSFKQIISKQDILSPEDQELVNSCIDGWLTDFCQYIEIRDQNLTADDLRDDLREYGEQYGHFVINPETNAITYEADDPDEIVLVALDHYGLVKVPSNSSKKHEIDRSSNYFIWFRNTCKYSFLPLIQMNRTSSSMDRRNKEMQETQLDDIKDSSGPSEDAELVLAIFNPWREKMKMCNGYTIPWIKDKFRSLQVLKNRFGEADKKVSINFFGSIGWWRELPRADTILHNGEQCYAPYNTLFEVDEISTNIEDEDTFTYTL